VIKVRNLLRIGGCPSEWSGDIEGGVFWARYKAGWLSWGVGATVEEAQDDSDRRPTVIPKIENRLGSEMSDDEIKKTLEGIVDFEA
jgi:hypothetical protein